MKTLIFFIFSLSILSLNAQNLVLNPSFETVNLANLRCSWYTSEAQFTSAISNWDYPNNGSTDIYHTSLATTCFSSPFSTNASSMGSQAPRTGNSMSVLVVYGSAGCSEYREYLQGELSSPLTAGLTYDINLYVSLADNSNLAISNIGVKFTATKFNQANNCVITTAPDVNYTGTPITDKINWVQLSYTFTPATSGLLYFTIGNFFNNASTPTTAVGGANSITRYFIDDVSVTGQVPLPIKLLNFTGKCNPNNTIILKWTTASEINNDYFTIEKSSDAINWGVIGIISGAGNSNTLLNYQFIDDNPQSETNYYRLKQSDFNGDFKYFKIVSVENCNNQSDNITVYPNPVTNTLQLTIASVNDANARIKIYDLLGNIIQQEVLTPLNEGNNKININVERLPKAMYVLVLEKEGQQYQLKFTK
jgi:Secretion system C-terminal sorting domain